MLSAANGGTGVANSNNLTVPATGTAALLGAANTFTSINSFTGPYINIGSSTGRSIFIQDATPTANQADDLWYETDTNTWWFWDGTFWLSTQVFSVTHTQYASADGSYPFPIETFQDTQHDIYLIDMSASTVVFTTNDGTKYWNIRGLRTSSGGVDTTLATVNTGDAPDTAGTYYVHKAAIGAHVDLSAVDAKMLKFYLFKTSTPGDMWVGVRLNYRLAHL